jgi:hypothetical protein
MFAYETFTNATMKRQLTKIVERPGLYATNDSELLEKVRKYLHGIFTLESNG